MSHLQQQQQQQQHHYPKDSGAASVVSGLTLAALNLHDTTVQSTYESETGDRFHRLRKEHQQQQQQKRLPGYLQGGEGSDEGGASSSPRGGRAAAIAARQQQQQQSPPGRGASPFRDARGRFNRRGATTPILNFAPNQLLRQQQRQRSVSPVPLGEQRWNSSIKVRGPSNGPQSALTGSFFAADKKPSLHSPAPLSFSPSPAATKPQKPISATTTSAGKRQQHQQHLRSATPPPSINTTTAFKLRQAAMTALSKKIDGPPSFNAALVPTSKPKLGHLTNVGSNTSFASASANATAAAAAASAVAGENRKNDHGDGPRFVIRADPNSKPRGALDDEDAAAQTEEARKKQLEEEAAAREQRRYWNRLSRPDPATKARTARERKESFRRTHSFSPSLSKRTRSGKHARLMVVPASEAGESDQQAESKMRDGTQQRQAVVAVPATKDKMVKPIHSVYHDFFRDKEKKQNQQEILSSNASFARAVSGVFTPEGSGVNFPPAEDDDDEVGPPPEPPSDDDADDVEETAGAAAGMMGGESGDVSAAEEREQRLPATSEARKLWRKKMEEEREAARYTTVRAPFAALTPKQRRKQAEPEATQTSEAILFTPSVTRKAAHLSRTVDDLRAWQKEKDAHFDVAARLSERDQAKEFLRACTFEPEMDMHSHFIVNSLADRRITVEDHALMSSRQRAQAAVAKVAERQAEKEKDLAWAAQQEQVAEEALRELSRNGNGEDRQLAAQMLKEKREKKKAEAAKGKLRICDVRRNFMQQVFGE